MIRAKSERWRSFSFLELAIPAGAFTVGAAASVALALALSPEPEEFGRLGLGIAIVLFLTITPLLFTLGFMAAETAHPHKSAGLRALRSAICGCVYIGGFLMLSWAGDRINSLWTLPEILSSIVLLSYWLITPPLLPVIVWRAGRSRSVRPTQAVAGNHGAS
jgi:hypothetical protein